MLQLKDNKACKSESIPTKLIKYSVYSIVSFLRDLYNKCLSQAIFPDSFKANELIPIFKKGNPEQSTNYRPISGNHQFNKIFENSPFSDYISILKI